MENMALEHQNDLKNQFLKLLSKLSFSETKDLAIKEIYNLITKNQNTKNIRVWLSSLLDYKRPANKSNNEYEILLIGFLATIYKTNLIDPIEKSPHITKTILKLINLLQNYFKDSDEKIHKACSKTWREIYTNCLLEETLEIRNLLMFEILLGIIVGGTDRLSQHTCLIILRDFIDCIGNLNDFEFLRLISQKVLPVFVKNVFDVPTILQIVMLIVGYSNWMDFAYFNKEIIEKTLFYLNNAKIPFNHYMFKVECCEIFKILAIKSLETSEYVIGAFHEKIINALMEATKDRVIKVQNAAKEAISLWNKVVQIYYPQEAAKTSQAFEIVNPDELINIRSSNNVYKNPGNNVIIPENDNRSRVNESDYEHLFKKNAGWIAETKGKNFIKKKSGTGGGFIVLGQNKIRKEYLRTSNENMKNELNDILLRSRENDYLFCENCNEIQNNQNPIVNQNIFIPKSHNELNKNQNLYIPKNNNEFPTKMVLNNPSELDDTLEYDSDHLDDTLDYNNEEEETKQQKYKGILEKEEQISDMWNKTLEYVDKNELDEAYTNVLNSGDDIYLIRLMMKTGSCLKKLRRKTAVGLLKRLSMIGKSNFLQKMCLNFLDEFKNKNAIESLKIEEQKKILDTLENMQRKKGALQQKSSELHEYFINKFN